VSELIKDINGREIEVAQVRGSALSRLTRVAGAAWGENTWTSGTLARATVVSVGGLPRNPKPITCVDELDRLWDEIDAEAAGAALDWIVQSAQTVAQDAKNSSAPQASESVSGS